MLLRPSALRFNLGTNLGTSLFTVSLLSLTLSLMLSLTACSNSPSASSSPVTERPAATPHDESQPHSHGDGGHEHGGDGGGQVLEVGQYHLGFRNQQQANGVALEFDLQQGADHAPIADAKVTAQVRLPDGTQQTIDFQYAPRDKHYKATLATTATGEFRVVMLADIGGEKVNGRFTFSPENPR
jgi:hypothetical protein